MYRSKQKKTVLFITHGLPPEAYGGVEVYTNNLYQSFKKSDVFFPLLLTRTDVNKFWPNLIWADDKDPQKFFIHTPHVDIFSLLNSESDDFFKEFLINTRPEIIHFQHYLHLSISWLKIAKETLPKSKVILTTHEYLAICPNSGQMIKTKWQNFSLCHKSSTHDCSKCFPYVPKEIIKNRRQRIREYFSHVDLFTGPSEFIKSRYVDFGVPAKKYIVSENGQRILKIMPHTKTSGSTLNLLYLGQINYFKGLHVLVDAMRLLQKEDVHLNIHGKLQDDVDYNKKLMTAIDELPNITFHGKYSQDDLPAILAQSDVLVVPSIWWENSPLVIQEGFMAKIPIICSDIGGMAEKVTDGVNGLHFKTGDSKDLSQKILMLKRNRHLLNDFVLNTPQIKSIKNNQIELETIYKRLLLG